MKNTLCTALISSMLICSTASLQAKELAYVTNEKSNSLSVIDLDDYTVIKEVPVGERPRGFIFNHDQTLAYICASDSDRIQIFDVASDMIIGALLTVIDIASQTVTTQIDVGVEPEGLAVSPDGEILVVTSETTNMVHWINTSTNQNYANSLVGARPRAAMFTKDGKELWVTSEIGGELTVFDVATQTVKHIFTFTIRGMHKDRIQPVGIVLMQTANKAFVALGPSNHVAVINTANMAIEKYILVGRRVWQLALNADESLLLTTNGVSSDVSIIDTQTAKVEKSVKVGRYPWGVAVKQL